MENAPLDIDSELARFAREEARKLGLEREQWVEPVRSNESFTAKDRATTTMLVSGLTLAHDTLVCAALTGLGYRVEALDAPDNAALQFGKEFGNRGQCNPTYYTVGNLVKHLVYLRDEAGLSTADIVNGYIFVTAGACGPCRFGMYVTEYRKALRDAGFDGFRVVLFQQQGGMKQATGDETGLVIDQKFVFGIVRALMAGDVLNLLAYRIRPYETVPGATDEALRECRELLSTAFRDDASVVAALWRCRRRLARIEVDRTQPKPVVSVIGEFWAMTTEGDGNYQLQRFLEQEGAEVDVQGVTNWLLFMVWENRYDTLQRQTLKQDDGGRKGLSGKDATKKLWMLEAAEHAVRAHFQLYAKAIGLHGYHLPDMEQIAALASKHYDNHVRGGEGHMEVGKLVHFIEDRVNHMTISVKPFGCMPSSGVSDGVQAAITARYPDAIFLPIETTGDGKVNVQSRIQMMLFRARQNARAELDLVLAEKGLDEASFKACVNGSRRWRSAFARPAHRFAGVAANLAAAV
ncbi:MAG: 2-hydroxyglutaryl-CoA dehydratase [Deltaproteobacteria bacterium]|nr:2-hydroxyglutaryl-CoA dehydratase [Deltaproteobacteria bacterium]